MQEGAIDPKQSCDPIGRPVIGVRFFHLTIVFRLISWRAESVDYFVLIDGQPLSLWHFRAESGP
jgi:hypothetical protein